jgi:hypothetical protein
VTPAGALGSSESPRPKAGPKPAHLLTEMGWRWMSLAGRGTQHLFPPRPGSLATSACYKVRFGPDLLETPDSGLFGTIDNRCSYCTRTDT